MFNFLKKKGKEKSTFFDNKVISTPKSSKIFRKFVQSENMGQNNSLDKANPSKTTLTKADSKDEEYNTAPNTPEINKCDLLSGENVLAIDDESESEPFTSLLQNTNQQQKRPSISESETSSPSASTCNSPLLGKQVNAPGATVVLKSTPEAFYTRKNKRQRNVLSPQTSTESNPSSSSKSQQSHSNKTETAKHSEGSNQENKKIVKQNSIDLAENGAVSWRDAQSIDIEYNGQNKPKEINNSVNNGREFSNHSNNNKADFPWNQSSSKTTPPVVNSKQNSLESDTSSRAAPAQFFNSPQKDNFTQPTSKEPISHNQNQNRRKEFLNQQSSQGSKEGEESTTKSKPHNNHCSDLAETSDLVTQEDTSPNSQNHTKDTYSLPFAKPSSNNTCVPTQNGFSETTKPSTDSEETKITTFEKEPDISETSVRPTLNAFSSAKLRFFSSSASFDNNSVEDLLPPKFSENQFHTSKEQSKQQQIQSSSIESDTIAPSIRTPRQTSISLLEKDVDKDDTSKSIQPDVQQEECLRVSESKEREEPFQISVLETEDQNKEIEKSLVKENQTDSVIKPFEENGEVPENTFSEDTKEDTERYLVNEKKTESLNQPESKSIEYRNPIFEASSSENQTQINLDSKNITQDSNDSVVLNGEDIEVNATENDTTTECEGLNLNSDHKVIENSDVRGTSTSEEVFNNNDKEIVTSEEEKLTSMDEDEEEGEEEETEEESSEEADDEKDLKIDDNKEPETNGEIEPPRKYKKFVRFVLSNNTYHGSETESEEESEEEEEEESEEEEEDEVEEEEEAVVKKQDEMFKEEPVATSSLDDKKEDDSIIETDRTVKSNSIMDETIDTITRMELDKIKADHDKLKTDYEMVQSENDVIRCDYENIKADVEKIKSDFEDRIHNLTSDLELKQLESNQLREKITELENKVLTKSWAMDRQEAELISAQKDSEHVRQKLRRLDDDMAEYRKKNSELSEELMRRINEENNKKEETCDFFKIRELEEKLIDAGEKIKALEEQLNSINRERDIVKEAEKIRKAEIEVEMKIMREALDEALKQKSVLQKRFESEFNQLRNVNTDREQQLLDDFEWKLREVEQSCKKKILETEKTKRELEAEVNRLKEEVEELSKFKELDAEVTQLRSVSHEHQKQIRSITRQKEELQVNERILNEEVARLRACLEKEKNHIVTMQAIHNREITEKNRKHQFKLEQQKSELQDQFEERLKKELMITKVDNEKHHLEDKRVAVEHTRAQAETKYQEQKKKWDKQLQDVMGQVENLREKLREKERTHRQELDSAQTHSDQSMLEMRRKFDKLDMSYQEQLEKAQENHERELERVNEECERRLSQCEASWQQQLSTTRTTLELVKEQMRRDTYEQVQQLKSQHQRELEEQWSRLIQERDEALAELEQRHRTTIEQLRNEVEIRSKKSQNENELLEKIKQLQKEVESKNATIASLHATASSQIEKSSTQTPITPNLSSTQSPLDTSQPATSLTSSPGSSNAMTNGHPHRPQDKRKRTTSEQNNSNSGGSPMPKDKQKLRKSGSTSQVLHEPTIEFFDDQSVIEHPPPPIQTKPPRRKHRGRRK